MCKKKKKRFNNKKGEDYPWMIWLVPTKQSHKENDKHRIKIKYKKNNKNKTKPFCVKVEQQQISGEQREHDSPFAFFIL